MPLPITAVLVLLMLAAPAEAQNLIIRPEVCAALTEFVAEPDVAYRPGRDVAGRPVPPADLPTARSWSFDEITIELTLDLRRKLGIPHGRQVDGEIELGHVTLRGGKAYLDGVPLQSGSEAALAALCRHAAQREPSR